MSYSPAIRHTGNRQRLTQQNTFFVFIHVEEWVSVCGCLVLCYVCHKLLWYKGLYRCFAACVDLACLISSHHCLILYPKIKQHHNIEHTRMLEITVEMYIYSKQQKWDSNQI